MWTYTLKELFLYITVVYFKKKVSSLTNDYLIVNTSIFFYYKVYAEE